MATPRTKQSTVTGTLMAFAIIVLTWGVTNLQNNVGEWWQNIAAIIVGVAMIIVDIYVLKGQENC